MKSVFVVAVCCMWVWCLGPHRSEFIAAILLFLSSEFYMSVAVYV